MYAEVSANELLTPAFLEPQVSLSHLSGHDQLDSAHKAEKTGGVLLNAETVVDQRDVHRFAHTLLRAEGVALGGIGKPGD